MSGRRVSNSSRHAAGRSRWNSDYRPISGDGSVSGYQCLLPRGLPASGCRADGCSCGQHGSQRDDGSPRLHAVCSSTGRHVSAGGSRNACPNLSTVVDTVCTRTGCRCSGYRRHGSSRRYGCRAADDGRCGAGLRRMPAADDREYRSASELSFVMGPSARDLLSTGCGNRSANRAGCDRLSSVHVFDLAVATSTDADSASARNQYRGRCAGLCERSMCHGTGGNALLWRARDRGADHRRTDYRSADHGGQPLRSTGRASGRNSGGSATQFESE